MHRSDPDQEAGVQSHAKRLAVVQRRLDDLSRRETLARGASVPLDHGFRWASRGPDAALTEDQEDFVDYWTPQRVLAECRAKRELICALDECALTTESRQKRDAAPAAVWASPTSPSPTTGRTHARSTPSARILMRAVPRSRDRRWRRHLCTRDAPRWGANARLGKSADAESTRPTTE